MKTDNSVVAIYSRKSKFTGKGDSIGNQIELCKEYVLLHFGETALEKTIVFEDEGFSGGNMNRPAFKKLITQIKNDEIDVLVVYRLDRVSRNVGDFSALIETLNHHNVVFVSIKEQFDTGTPMGRAMMYIASVFSQLERETIAERIRDNMHELAKTGRWLGGVTPTGYKSESVKTITLNGKTKKTCKLKLIPEEAAVIKNIYELFSGSGSLSFTEAELLKNNVLTKNMKQYSRFSIKSILQNPVYMIADKDAYEYFTSNDINVFSSEEEFDGTHGIIAYNRTNQKKGSTTIFNCISEWIISVGKHTGIISGKEWITVQEKIKRNKTKSFRRTRKNEALLGGLLFCKCGSQMYPKISSRNNKTKEVIYCYVCKIKERSKKSICQNVNVNGCFLDNKILHLLKNLSHEKNEFTKCLQQRKDSLVRKRMNSKINNVEGLKREKSSKEKKVISLVDTLADLEDITVKNTIITQIAELNKNVFELSQKINEIENSSCQEEQDDFNFFINHNVLDLISDGIDCMTYEQKRELVGEIIQRIVWDGENAHVLLSGCDDEEIIK